jgi:hypothetical protein
MLKRDWAIIVLVYLAVAEFLSLAPLPDLSLCLVQPKDSEQHSNSDNKKYCPAFHTGAALVFESADAFLERHDKSVVGFFTIVLAISTIGLWLATNKLWVAGEKQFGLLSESSTSQSRDMQASIDIAREANQFALNGLISNQRPWVIIESASTGAYGTGKKLGVLAINDERIIVGFSLNLKNVGKGPAQNVSVDARLEFFDADFGESQRRICADVLRSRSGNTGIIIFPDREYPGQWSAIASADELKRATMLHENKGWLQPVVVGCITYDFPPNKYNCQTSFLYWEKKPDNPFGVLADVSEIKGESLILANLPFAGIAT